MKKIVRFLFAGIVLLPLFGILLLPIYALLLMLVVTLPPFLVVMTLVDAKQKHELADTP